MPLRFFNNTKTVFYIPETKEEWEDLKQRLITKQKFDDSPETWTFVLSQLQGVKMPEITTTSKYLIDHYKRWKIAKVLQDEKSVYLAELQAKLEEKLAALQKDQGNEGTPSPESDTGNDVPQGASDTEGQLPRLPEAEAGVVQSPGW